MTKIKLLAFLIVWPFLGLSSPPKSQFFGSLLTEWISSKDEGDGRKLKLINDFGYTDFEGKTWLVPSGAIIDESSIPKLVRELIGDPLTSECRNAAVIHTYFCKLKIENWYAVHRMFYEACVTTGMPETKAKVIYAAVFASGPRWIASYGKSGMNAAGYTLQGYTSIKSSISEKDFEQTQKWIEAENPGLDAIVFKLHPLLKSKTERVRARLKTSSSGDN